MNESHLIKTWVQKVKKEIPFLRERSESFIIDHVPAFLELITHSLRRPQDKDLLRQCKENSKLHGALRAEIVGYSGDELSLEYTLLRECIFSESTDRPSEMLEQMNAFLMIFDASVSAAISAFTQARWPDFKPPSRAAQNTLADSGASPRVETNTDLAHFFAQAPFPLALLSGPEHVFVMANQPYFDLIGKNPIGKKVKDAFTSAEGGEFFTLLDSVYHTGIAYVGDALPFQRYHKDGTPEDLFLNIAYHPYHNAQGVVTGILAYVYDVTTQHLARQKIEKSESRLRAIFSHGSVGFVVTDLADKIIEANPRFSEITGYAKNELHQLHFLDLVFPADLLRERHLLSELMSRKISNFTFEKRLIKKDQSVIWVRSSVSLVSGDHEDHLIVRVAEEVTDLIAAKYSQAESEERYRQLADSMPQIVWTANSAGELDYFNQVWFNYSGTSYSENVGSGWTRAVHPDDLARTAKNWTHALSTLQIYENEFRLRDKDGNYRWFVARALPTFDDQRKVKAWFGTNTDIHESKIVNQQLADAKSSIELEQTKFKTIFADSTSAMAVLQGPELVYEIANPSYLALFNNRNLVGKPFLEALPELKDQEFPAIAKRVFETGQPYQDRNARAYLRRTDEDPLEERYFDQAYTRMVSADGTPYGVYIHAIEVTERVLAQKQILETNERFNNAVNAANMGTWEVTPETGIVIWSERTNELFGIPRSEKVPLTAAVERIHPEDRDRVQKAITEAMDPRGDGKYEIEYRITHENGDTRWVSLRGQSFFTETPAGRKTTKFSGTVLDVTDRIMSEVALRDAKEKAEAANAAKSTFLANMSHEIRTPLGAIMGFVSLIKDEHVSQSTLSNYVSVIERNSAQLLRIIDDILDLSKVEAGLMQVEHIEFSLIELLSDFASLMGFKAREKGVLFTLQATTPLPDGVITDPTRLRQILTNIVGNAIKFTTQGSVKLTVTFLAEKVHFEVEDTGKGIEKDQIPKLFQPFAQGDLSTTRKFGGTGLGLVLTRKLSEVLGGSFELKSSIPGAGSVFTASIHVDLPENSKLVKALGFASQTIKDAGIPHALQNMKVLLVEDSLDNQDLFTVFLSKAGASIDIASDGKSGYEMALSNPYDAVLMDVQMPIMDGVTAVKILRSKGYQIPVIALTAHAMKEEKARCLDAGYTAFLSKPVHRNDLIELLAKFRPV